MTENRTRSVYFLDNNEDYIKSLNYLNEKGKKISFNKTVNRVIEEHKEKHTHGNN